MRRHAAHLRGAQHPPPDTVRTGAAIAEYGDGVRRRLREWWAREQGRSPKDLLETYYGPQTLHELLERSAWHSAQHVRHWSASVAGSTSSRTGTLSEEDLAGFRCRTRSGSQHAREVALLWILRPRRCRGTGSRRSSSSGCKGRSGASWRPISPQRARLREAGLGTATELRSLDDLPACRSARRATCSTITPSGCWPSRASSSCGSTLRAGRAASRRWSATPATTWRSGSEVMGARIAGARVESGWVLHNAYGYGLFTGGLGFHMGGELLGCSVVPISGGFTQRQVMILQDLGGRRSAARRRMR